MKFLPLVCFTSVSLSSFSEHFFHSVAAPFFFFILLVSISYSWPLFFKVYSFLFVGVTSNQQFLLSFCFLSSLFQSSKAVCLLVNSCFKVVLACLSRHLLVRVSWYPLDGLLNSFSYQLLSFTWNWGMSVCCILKQQAYIHIYCFFWEGGKDHIYILIDHIYILKIKIWWKKRV